MYPNMCFSDSMYEVVDKEAGEKLREVLTTEEYEKVLAEGDYQVRMKYFSWLNRIWRSWLKTKIKAAHL